VLIPCDSPELPSVFAAELAGGSQAQFDALESPEFEGFKKSLESFVNRIDSARPAEALSLSDAFTELSDQYQELRPEGEDRLKRAEFVRLVANVAGSRAADSTRWSGILDRVIVAHRAILGNVNFGYLADWLFTGESEVQ
jgi:hypothetical protein